MIPRAVEKLIDDFRKLPGIGPKTAQRLAFYMMYMPEDQVKRFANNLERIKSDIVICSECKNVAESQTCSVCNNLTRDRQIIAVVANPLDAVAMEKAGFKGIYQVLHGVIDPLNGIGPEELFIEHFINRLEKLTGEVPAPLEILLATGASLEGESTAMYTSKLVKAKFADKVKVTRIAKGLPMGGDVEFADEITLARAIEGRQSI